MSREEVTRRYLSRYEPLRQLGDDLSSYLTDIVGDTPHVDRISVRAKSPDRFVDKAMKDADGTPKYADPLNEIQDQVGGRITVFYLSDVARMKDLVLTYFTPIEITKKEPARAAEFGYFGEHFILKIPDDVIPEELPEGGLPEFFELQIKTLFQHAWSEADHDLAYKTIRDLDALEQRQLAFSAAQAWGADQIFESLARKLAANMAESDA